MVGCLRAVAATVLLIQEARKLTMGQKITVYVPHLVISVLEQKGGHWLSPSRMLKYQVTLLEQDDVELKTTTAVNPAMFLSSEMGESLHHDCLQTIEQVYSSRQDLKDKPLTNPDLELFMDGSSFVRDGKRMAEYAVVTTTRHRKQIHTHGAIWKERGLLSDKEEILQLLQDIQQPKEVVVMHCKAHQFGQTVVNVGNRLADKTAREAAEQSILALVPVKQVKLPTPKPNYGSPTVTAGPIEPVPVGSKTDPPLAKAEPVSNGGSASVITYLRRGKKLLRNSSWERGVRICERNNSADTKVSEEGGGGGAPGTGAEIPLQHVVKTMVKQVVPLQPMEVHSGADIHTAACGGPHARAGGYAPKEVVIPWRACAGAGSWQDLWPCGGDPTLEQVFCKDL
ncbi:hypothetical protein QYF61_013348 [Mycteria americana]|uniref:RNase H type-1 domain-containing protein n=1 Tax=Mycteria americana TaxID=33587 RepID=A0AAN7N918_MYCAM|nr:hypothetical protein QYF61_013348 [Mycteria americana]